MRSRMQISRIASRLGADTLGRHQRSHPLGHPAIREVIEPSAERGEFARAGASDIEIGYSARSEVEWDRLVESLEVFDLVETTAGHIVRARQVQRMLASRRQRGRKVPDLLVAAAAEARGLVVLHYDADFDRIAKVTGQECEWVVSAGSVD
jgi:predicted nucleic acid-binding protein